MDLLLAKVKIEHEEEDDLGGGEGKKIKIQRAKPNRPEVRKVAAPVNLEDLENVKKSIQNLCQSTNPLGKSMEFVSDDIESMKKEFERWSTPIFPGFFEDGRPEEGNGRGTRACI